MKLPNLKEINYYRVVPVAAIAIHFVLHCFDVAKNVESNLWLVMKIFLYIGFAVIIILDLLKGYDAQDELKKLKP